MRFGRPAAALLVALLGCLGAVAYAGTVPRPGGKPAPQRGGPKRAGTLPTPVLTRRPARLEVSTAATFGFRAKRSPSFECRLDARPWRACRSPLTVAGLGAGGHRFGVRAVGRSGSHGPLARFRWRVLERRDFSIAPRLESLGPLFPGAAPQELPLTISNPNPVPIFVTAIAVAAASAPAGCGDGNLALAAAGVSPSAPLRVPPRGSIDLPTAGVAAPSIQLRDLPVNQDACQGATFPLSFSGRARG